MKLFYLLLLLSLSHPMFADVTTYSTGSKTLSVPLLVINGGVYYQDVDINLDPGTGKFTILSANRISADEIGTQDVSVSLDAPGMLFTNDTLTLLDVQDSRCPTGAQCIVAGQVIIGLQLHNHLTDAITLMELRLDGNGEVPGDTVKTEEYTFRLLDATPYPDLDTILDDSDYTFKVEYSLNTD